MALPLDAHPAAAAVPFASGLAAYGDRTAIVTPTGHLSYRDLATRVDRAAARFAGTRRLVLLAAGNTIESVVAYLAALAAGQPLLLVPGDSPRTVDALAAAYDPDVIVDAADGQLRVDERRNHSAHTLHPDLALLLSTSGSTGSPKLVRLSRENLQANAEAIASYLGIRDSDRAATTLPMHYCYGLSVINSHLLRGAALILTELSVVDPCFWDQFRTHRGTSFAGVPYTFDLLDRAGFDQMYLPHLRYVTQAGGRLDPERVRRYAAVGRAAGWDLIVMYGQTEATARMAYLPPHLVEFHPHAIGVPIPGGSFRLAPTPGHTGSRVGELVYTGPNVMLGYAETPSDLRLGRTVDELYTGDIARRTGDGMYEIVGRRSRFIKVFGQRIDLERIETLLARRGLPSCCAGADGVLVVAVQGCDDTHATRRMIARECGLPPRAVQVHAVDQLPRLATGKLDHQAVLDIARRSDRHPTAPVDPRTSSTAGRGAELRALFAEILDCPDVTDDSSFVDLGGDSLSYVELSVRLERQLGRLPASWHTMPIRDLRRIEQQQHRRRVRMLDTTVAVRAIAIVLIVGTHIKLFAISGGAHLLFGVAGFNFARFQLTSADRHSRIRKLGHSISRIALPSMLWITGALLLTDDYHLANAFLVNSLVGTRGDNGWHFWFVEALVFVLVALAAVLAVPTLDKLERRFPFGLPIALMAAGLAIRYDLLGIDSDGLPSAVRLFWLFTLGWAAAKATARWQRVCVSIAVAATVPGFFGQPEREAIIIAGMLLLVWVSSIPGIPGLNQVAGVLASSSLYIYLTHWQVFPRIDHHSQLLALVASLAVGIAYATAIGHLTSKLKTWRTSIPALQRRTRRQAAASGSSR